MAHESRTPGRQLGRQVAGGELSTRCSDAQQESTQCERRFSAARTPRVIRKAGQSDPLLWTLSRPEPRSGRGRSGPRARMNNCRSRPTIGRESEVAEEANFREAVERSVERSPEQRVLPGVRSKARALATQNPTTLARGSRTTCRRRCEPESRPVSAAEVHDVSRAK